MRGINESCPCVVFQAEFSEYARNKRVLSLCCVSGGVL